MRLNDYRKTATTVLALMAAMVFAPSGNAALANYSQNFEGLNQADEAALGNDGWKIFANVYSGGAEVNGGTYVSSYPAVPEPAPNNGPGFSTIVQGQGGVPQGDQQLSVYSDYSNIEMSVYYIDALVFQEQTIGAADAGSNWSFSFDAKQGNQSADSSSLAFIKTLDGSFVTTQSIDTTGLGTTWGTYTLDLLIPADNSLDGQLLQFGFSSTATNWNPSGVFYDNINFSSPSAVPIPGAVWLMLSGLIGLFGVARRRNS
jgi:hypothetical protein